MILMTSKILLSLSIILISISIIVKGSATSDDVYDGSLDSCRVFASTFQNTCADNFTQTPLWNVTGQNMTCSGAVNCTSINATSSGVCNYTRVLCVTCFD